ncbi:MAG TPA: Dabb family protein [Geminicoccus sp.]|uniref:Dabb family protein n=1 Tax=Geminicoccus sp. TaxID=2024832 RepID=UPI002E376102|nr:Dabb family protein [Geminicoccus sp.]HEX2528133.1 Dabb family protein [Geminicoccus sp.]
MIRHVVLFKLRKDLDEGKLQRIFDGLAGLRHAIPGMVDFHGSANCSPEGLNKNYTHGFTIDFMDVSARDAYLVDPEHKSLGQQLTEASEGGVEGLLVLDINLSDAH